MNYRPQEKQTAEKAREEHDRQLNAKADSKAQEQKDNVSRLP